jgi:hypothetical protein
MWTDEGGSKALAEILLGEYGLIIGANIAIIVRKPITYIDITPALLLLYEFQNSLSQIKLLLEFSKKKPNSYLLYNALEDL